MKKSSIIISLIILLIAVMVLTFVMSCQSPPVVPEEPGIRLSSDFFNPKQEQLTIYLPAIETPQVLSWRVEVLEPHPSNHLFRDWVGRGQPPQHINWDGRNYSGEWVHPASQYPLVYYVSDVFGNIRTIESTIVVDVFVTSEGTGNGIGAHANATY